MLSKKFLVFGIITVLIVTGCQKKDKKESSLSDMPSLEETSAKDTSDIFDEFYSDAEKKESEEMSKGETFSTAGYVPDFVPDGRYVVQVSCVKSQEVGEDVVRQLESRGYPAYLAEVSNPTPDLLGIYYRVRISGFNGMSKAKEFGENALVPNGYEYWVDNKSNDNVGMGGYGLGETGASEYQSTPSTGSEYTTGSQSDWGSSSSTTSSASEWETTTPEPAVTPTTETAPSTDASASESDTWGTSTPQTETQSEPAPAAPTDSGSAAPSGGSDDWGGGDNWSDDNW